MKKLLYVSCLCSPELLNYIFATALRKPLLSIQKFHLLLAEGFAMHQDSCSIETLSSIPVTTATHSKRIWRVPSVMVKNVKYHFVSTLNFPVIKNILVFIIGFFKTLLWAFRGGRQDKVIICDVLNVSISTAALIACKMVGIKTIAIVTDLPNLMLCSEKNRGFQRRVLNKITTMLMLNYDGYILLTEQMNQVVNGRSRPYLIMEGLVDADMVTSENRLKEKASEKIVVYAGGIYEKYGVKKLIDAFMRLSGDDLRLHIYGHGEMAKDMPDYMKQDSRIVYFGTVANDEVVKKQLQATLLINPRPSSAELTKYSFPSKNMESMVSGTPLLATPLPGMPQDHRPFVYIFDDESIDGMFHTLRRLLAKPREELHEFGRLAKQFVLTHKSNRIQAKHILSLLEAI